MFITSHMPIVPFSFFLFSGGILLSEGVQWQPQPGAGLGILTDPLPWGGASSPLLGVNMMSGPTRNPSNGTKAKVLFCHARCHQSGIRNIKSKRGSLIGTLLDRNDAVAGRGPV